MASRSSPALPDAASGRLRDGTLSPVTITGLPKWSLEVALTYRQGFAERENTAVAEILIGAVSRRFGPAQESRSQNTSSYAQ
jgi:hypothetical protein